MEKYKEETEYGVKFYSYTDLILCILRTAFVCVLLWPSKMYIPISLLSGVGLCKFISIIEIGISDKIISHNILNFDKHDAMMERLNGLNRKMAFWTVILPHVLQFLLAFYFVSKILLFSLQADGYVWLLILCSITILFISIFAYSFLSIVTKEGFTKDLIKDFSFKAYSTLWGEGLIIIFWSIIYFSCSLLFGYNVFINGVIGESAILPVVGFIIFNISLMQTIKVLNVSDVFKQCCGNIIFYDYLTFLYALSSCRRQFLRRHKITILWILITTLTLSSSISYICYSLIDIMQFNIELTTIALVISFVSVVVFLQAIRCTIDVPLMKDILNEFDDTLYYTEYVDVSNYHYLLE